jgi:hypothetical protein
MLLRATPGKKSKERKRQLRPVKIRRPLVKHGLSLIAFHVLVPCNNSKDNGHSGREMILIHSKSSAITAETRGSIMDIIMGTEFVGQTAATTR